MDVACVPLGEPVKLLPSDIVVGEISSIGEEALFCAPFQPKKFEILVDADEFCL